MYKIIYSWIYLTLINLYTSYTNIHNFFVFTNYFFIVLQDFTTQTHYL